MKRFLSGILAVMMVLVCLPTQTFAVSDIENNWAKEYITYLNSKEVMFPSGENFKPNAEVSRAEFMRYINRAFQFTEKADVSQYTDLDATAWYYDSVATAVAYGYINGTGANTMNPLGTITRQEVVTILGRLHKYEPQGSDSITFKDKASIGSWAIGYINEAVEKGYVDGYTDGSFKPTAVITRSEMAKILYYFMGDRLDSNAQYDSTNLETKAKNVTITTGLDFANTTVNGDLYISEGAKGQSVTLSNVVVNGRIIVSGGKLMLEDVTAQELITSTPMGEDLSVTCKGNTNVATVAIKTNTDLTEDELDISASGISDVIVDGKDKLNADIDAHLWSLTVNNEGNSIYLDSNAYIIEMIANAAVKISGSGQVEKAMIHAENVVMEMMPETYEMDRGLSAVMGGETISGNSTVTVKPALVTFDKNTSSSAYADVEVELSIDPNTAISYTLCDSTKWTKGTQYRTSDTKVRILKSYLANLSEGNHTIQFVTDDPAKITMVINVIDSSKNSAEEEEVNFDKYSSSEGYQDVKINLVPANNYALSKVNMAGVLLEQGTAYTYSNHVVTIKKSFLETRTTGTYNLVFTFAMGNTVTVLLNIKDSSPVNSLGETEIKFDVNTNSNLYRDVVLKLSTVDGATLENVKYGSDDKLLTPVADYYVLEDEGTVTLRKRALAKMNTTSGSVKVTFVMSKGENPELTVTYVNTYAVDFQVVNDLGIAVNGAKVTIKQGAETVDTLTTDAQGNASTALEKGEYSYIITYGTSEPVEGDFRINSGSFQKSVTIVAMNEVSVNVVTKTGSRLSGAEVTLGSQKATTSEDGVAVFTVPAGSYNLTVSKSGYTTYTETMTIISKTSKRVILS